MLLTAAVAFLQATAIAAPLGSSSSGVSVNLSVSDLLLLANALATGTNVALIARRRKAKE
jgi:hypothetical protein